MPRANATYEQIIQYVHDHHGYWTGTNQVAEAKERAGLPVRRAHNRIDSGRRTGDFSQEYIDHIYEAFRHFGMLPTEAEPGAA